MKFIRILFILIVPLLFLILGFRAGLLTSSSAEQGSENSQDINSLKNVDSQTNFNKQQFNLLFVSLGSRDAQNLKSAWLVSYHHSNPNLVNFVPLYPTSHDNADQLNDLLESNFSLLPSGELFPAFLDTLQAIYMVNWDGYLIIDTAEISQSINFLGGIQHNGSILDGNQTAAMLYNATNNKEKSDIIQSICTKLISSNDTEQLGGFADYITAHLTTLEIKTGISQQSLRTLIKNPQLKCAFPTID